MRFARLRVRNFKCFESIDVELSAGATVMYGVNGSGKSSLLEACFFALYGSAALPSGTNLESIVTKGCSETEIELWFDHHEYQYHLEREIRVTESQTIHDATLRTPGAVIETVTGVEEEITEVLRMDAEAFLNCAYIRQGDITRLLSASPDQRQRMIDELLQLGKLESYRDRMDRARRGVDRVRRDRASKLENIQAEIDSLTDRDLEDQLAAVHGRINDVESELDELNDTIEDHTTELTVVEDELAEIEDQRQQLADVTDELDEKRTELSKTKTRSDSLESTIDQLVTDRESLTDTLKSQLAESSISLDAPFSADRIDPVHDAVIDRLEELEAERTTLTETLEETRRSAQEAAAESNRLRDQAATRAEQAREQENRAEALRVNAREKRAERMEVAQELREIRNRITEKKSQFASTDVPTDIEFGDATVYRDRIQERLDAVRERKETIRTSVTALEQRIEHAETLIEEGKCPECGQPVEGAPEVATLDADKEQAATLREELESVNEEITTRESDLEEARSLIEIEREVDQLNTKYESRATVLDEHDDQIEDLIGSAIELFADARDKRESTHALEAQAETYDEQRDAYIEEIESSTDEQSELADRISAVEAIRDHLTELERVLENHESAMDQLADVKALREEQAAAVRELTETKTTLEDSLDDDRVGSLENTHEAIADELEALTEEREELTATHTELTEKRGELRSEINRFETIRERAEELSEKVSALESVVGECADIQELYATLRTELRQQNVRQLEVLLNEIFDLVYQNDSYARIELSDDYELSVHEKSGEVLDPSELSGGEKALFNLSLRCAIYQLLAEGISGQSPLPPLILDEPTVHLDGEHVNRISDLVDRMRDLGVEQTIVVSHEVGIVDGADERIEVVQNPSTNRSTVNVESTDLLAGLTG